MRAIHNAVTSFKRGKAQRPSSRQPSPCAPTGDPDRKGPGLPLLSGGAASPSLLISRRHAGPILALLAALAVGLLVLLPGGLLQAQQTADTFYHHENDTGPVVTLSAADPERVTPIVWSLPDDGADPDGTGADNPLTTDDVEDNEDFVINDAGELRFSPSADYEVPTNEDTNNVYNAVVQASDGGLTTWVEYFKVTVTVLDEEETGEVEWTVDPADTFGTEDAGQDLLEFQAGAVLTATVTDPDGDAATTGGGVITDFAIDTVTWRWYRSSSMSARGTVITDGTDTPVETATYTVSDEADSSDVGMYLRAVATYTDRRGRNKTAEFVSPYQVRLAKLNQNSLPEFASTSIDRTVQEGSAGMVVGAPVTATDADGDVLNYTLEGTIPQVGGENAFRINRATGQITTNAVLNYDGEPAPTREFTVIVRATDSAGGETGGTGAGDPADATVTITLLDVNEAPTFGTVDTAATPPENIRGMAADKAEEGVDNTWDATVSSYTVSDPEGVVINGDKWSLAGDDAARFQLTGSTDNVRTLEFREKADFEMPTDADTDNIYKVTVVASDGEEMAERAVTVKITDSDEAGMITLSSENPVTGTAITATLEDSDGDVINEGWTWYPLTNIPDTAAALDTAIAGATAIRGATSDSYTPVAGDIGMHLVAVVRYMDRTEDEDNDSTNALGVRFDNMARSAVTAAVIDDPANARPEFEEGDRAVRYVEEHSEADGDVRAAETIGAPLAIDDADLPGDSHTFTLSGPDADSFDIMAGTGQLMTKPDVMLDYEDKMTYTVIAMVEDGSGEDNDSDRITVTIQVKGLDEKPEIQGDANAEHYENDTGPVVTLSAADPERVTPIVWSLPDDGADPDGTGADNPLTTDDVEDNEDFVINDAGELRFSPSADYEVPTNEDTNNVYNAVVQASDGGLTTWVEYFKVTVTVLDEEETGEVEWTVDPADTFGTEDAGQDLLEFQAGAVLTATVTDPDGDAATTGGGVITDFAIDTVTWRWYRSSSMSARGTVITDGTDTPVETATYAVSDEADSSDVGMYLRAVATYTDRRGPATAEFVSPYQVRLAKLNQNSLPEFAPPVHVRRVQEGSAGMVVGAPVTATDADGDVLNYTLEGTIPQVGGENAFRINRATGQITTNAVLNYDGEPAPTREFTVIVRATDSAGGETGGTGAGDPADATVTITLLDVNEAPTFGTVDTAATPPENIRGMAADKAEEGVDNTWDATVSSYTVSDPEGVVINGDKWSLAGDDAARFQLTGSTDNVRTLEFREKADFEMPTDADTDNIYKVTVVASDGEEMAERAVTVKITDSDEAGMITLSSENPVTGTAITATLEDSDGDVINEGWTWYPLTNIPDTAAALDTAIAGATAIRGATSDSYTPVAGDIGMHLVAVVRYMDRTEDEDNDSTNALGVRFDNMARSAVTAAVIDDPANARPEFEEGDRAVRYVEEHSEADGDVRAAETIGAPLAIDDDDGVTTTSHSFTLSRSDADSFDIMAGTGQLMTKPDVMLDYEDKMTYTATVTVKDSSNQDNDSATITVTIEVKDLDEKPVLIVRRPPTFTAATTARSVAENTPARGNIGAPVEASDDDALTYTLSGTDAGSFDIDEGTGQLRAKSALDYETKNTYTVTVRATDGEGATDEITVTINVTNVDELGMVSGDATVDYAENGTAAVATYTADGPASATWTLSGDDAGDFTISNGGELTFRSSPNHEAAADADTDNVYQVTVEADAGGEMGMVAVTITVTNEDELGMVSGDATVDYAENDTVAVATYTADGPASATWTLSGDDAGDFTISNGGELTFRSSPNYESPADADMDNVYQVTVEADAGGEMGTVAVTITVTNEDELGMVSGDATVDYAENDTVAVATYTADGPASATWTLSGDDAGDFTISNGGELTFRSSPNYESPADAGMDNVYQVTVEADAGGEMGMVAVTVTVTNEDELGMVSGDATVDYAENDTVAVATYTADGPASATWTLSGDDAGDFTISNGGELTFRSSPNYESPADAGMDNVYQVTVEADAGGEMGMVAVTVTVTNVEEDGTVDLSSTAPQVGVAITASVTDLDGGVTGTTWQWVSSATADGTFEEITGATAAAYSPVDGDAGNYLRATASYTDGYGADTAKGTSANAVAAAEPADDLLAEYDPNNDGVIEKADMRRAVANYFGTSPTLTKAEMRRLVGIYFS